MLGVGGGRVRDPVARAMTVLAPRGPDGGARGEAALGAQPVTFGARRLALVDPGSARQPVRRPSGAMLVWNGELYNHDELRTDLAERGETFRTANDGEVLAVLLERDGVAGLSRVEGSYAFAFLVGPEGPLLLGRDPLGVRPLVYAHSRNVLHFASTVDALLAMGGLAPRANLEAIADVLRDGVVTTRHTAVHGVHRVTPGEVLSFDADLHMASHEIPTAKVTPEMEDLDVLDALRGAVWDRLRTDRPSGVFLSGGVDSALVAALAREVGDVPAYTLSFPGHAGVDEADRARRTAARIGIKHVVVPCPADPTPWVLGAARAFDEPFADASAIPTWGLARAAGRDVRVALTGTGGDEVFGGYRRYWLVGTGPWLRHVPAFIREPVSRVLERTAPGGARLLRASSDPQGIYRGLLRLQPVQEIRAVVGPLLADVALPVPRSGPTTAKAAMRDDLQRYLPDDLLVKEDRALMSHGIEGRHPFLDARVRAAASSLELRGRPGRGKQKKVLRAYVQEVIDPDLARVAKHGFAFPVDDLYRGPLQSLARDALLGKSARERGFISPAGARRLLQDHVTGARDVGQTVHVLVMLELWARRVLDGDAV